MACLAVYTILSIGASFVCRANKIILMVLHTKLASMLRKMAFPLLPDKAADGLRSKSLLQSSAMSMVCKACTVKAWPPKPYHNKRDISHCQAAALQQSTACLLVKMPDLDGLECHQTVHHLR